MYYELATPQYISECLELAEMIYSFGAIQDEDMPIEPEGFREVDWETYHDELNSLMGAVNQQ